MRQVTKEVLSFLMTLILAYLILIHSTGFGKDVGAIGSNLAKNVKVLQGR